MIIDLQRFIAQGRGHWTELESLLVRLEGDAGFKLSLEQSKHFHYLYQRTSADLAKITTFGSEPETRRYLESLVARAYGEIHETREKPHRWTPVRWFFHVFPQTFRRHFRAFCLSAAITLMGSLFGGLAIGFDPDAKAALMPFSHLQGDPRERVAHEEQATTDRLSGVKGTFSTSLMTHNTKVSVLTLALGMTWGVGTVLMLFYNGVILGAVASDYVLAGQTKFLVGWLLPHGSFEIPAILIAGQAGLILGGALIGWGGRTSLVTRLRQISHDLVTLILGVAILLVWAGFVEAFLSQYHEPVIPYWAKISFGAIEVGLLALFLARSGSRTDRVPVSALRDAEFEYAEVSLMRSSKTNTLLIRTPEGIAFSFLLAGPVTRFLAWALDTACIGALCGAVGSVLGLLRLLGGDFAGAVIVMICFVVQIGYGIALEWGWRGQTIGKRLLRLRVVDAHGLRLQFSQVVVRNLLRFVDMLPVLYLVGGIACLLSRHAQRLGDVAANTVVIRQPEINEPDLDQLLAGKFNSLRGYPHLAARLHQRVSSGEARVALQALLRREELDAPARLELFQEIAAHFRSLVEFPPEATEGITDEQYIRNTVDILFRPQRGLGEIKMGGASE